MATFSLRPQSDFVARYPGGITAVVLALVFVTSCKNPAQTKHLAAEFCDSLQTQFEAADAAIGAGIWENALGRFPADSLRNTQSLWYRQLNDATILAQIDKFQQTISDSLLLHRLQVSRKRTLIALLEHEPAIAYIVDSLRPSALKQYAKAPGTFPEFRNDSIPLLYRRREIYHQLAGTGADFSSEIVRLARLRNQRCQTLGYSSLLDLNLQLSGLTRDDLDNTVKTIDSVTIGAYRKLLQRIATKLSHHSLEEADIYFYENHVLDRFRRRYTRTEALAFALDVLTGLGFNVRYASLFIDSTVASSGAPWLVTPHPPEDIRLAYKTTNKPATADEVEALLYQLGESVFLLSNPETPYMLRKPTDPLTKHCIGQLFVDLLTRRELQGQYNHISREDYELFSAAVADAQLIRLRSLLTMIRFEIELYDDPNRDMTVVYRNVVSKTLLVKPDKQFQRWTNRRDLALEPATQFCRLYASSLSAQIYSAALREFGSLANNPRFGKYLLQTYFEPLTTAAWTDVLLLGAGEQLNLKYFLDRFAVSASTE